MSNMICSPRNRAKGGCSATSCCKYCGTFPSKKHRRALKARDRREARKEIFSRLMDAA